MAKLVIYEEIEGAETIFEDFELSSHRILIGSSEDNNLVLDVPGIDPIHASLELRNDYWILQDLGGPGGTVLNDETIEGPRRLNDNDLIELSSVRITFHTDKPDSDEKENPSSEEASALSEQHLSGRVWFGTIASITAVVIFAILLVLVVADYMDLLKIADLLPPWFGNP